VWRKAPVARDATSIALETLRRALLNGALGLRRVARAADRAWCESRAIRAMEALDDRMLRDIGIVRSEIPYRVRRPRTAES
jgi:uncharacterized protein YjiS (DUF1127 family)